MAQELARVIDWPAVYRDVRTGVLSKGEICRKYNVDRPKLQQKLDQDGITADLETATLERVRSQLAVSVLTTQQMIEDAADRSVSVIKSHLTLTRALQARLQGLIDGYDHNFGHKATEGTIDIDQEGNPVQGVKHLLLASTLLDQIAKTAERLTRIEMNTFGPARVNIEVKQTKTENTLVIKTDNPIEAASAYSRLMSGR